MSLPYFRFSILDWVVAISVSIITWFGLRFMLWYAPPFTDEVISYFTLSARREFFLTLVWPAMILLSTPGVVLVRSIRRKIDYFTPLGQIAFAWPLASFLLLNVYPM